jgi:hypothetical protein
MAYAQSVSSLRFEDERFVALGYVRGLHELLRAIDEAMPEDAVLYLEGKPARDVKEFLNTRSVSAPIEVERGTVWPKQEVFHLPLVGTNLAELRQLADQHAGPEICYHLVVYREDEALLWAHDAGAGYVLVSKALSAETTSHLERLLASALRK